MWNDTWSAKCTRVQASAWQTVDAIPQSWVQPKTYESKKESEECTNKPEILVPDDVAIRDISVGLSRNQRI